MTKKKKKKDDSLKPWCYYCDRIFNEEPTLIQHQKAKHFKCPTCNRKLNTAQGLTVHSYQVHKVTLPGVPGAKEGRESFDVEIFGMAGIPEGMKPGGAIEDEQEPKRQKLDTPPSLAPPPILAPPAAQAASNATAPPQVASSSHMNAPPAAVMPPLYPAHPYPPGPYLGAMAPGPPPHLPPNLAAPGALGGGYPPGMPRPLPYAPMQPPAHAPPLGHPPLGMGPPGPVLAPIHGHPPNSAGPPPLGGFLPPPGAPLFPVAQPSNPIPGTGMSSATGAASHYNMRPGSGPSTGAASGASIGTANAISADPSLVWQDEEFSMEERRAMTSKYGGLVNMNGSAPYPPR